MIFPLKVPSLFEKVRRSKDPDLPIEILIRRSSGSLSVQTVLSGIRIPPISSLPRTLPQGHT
jgi:hypothetical protein